MTMFDLVCLGYNPWSAMWKRNQQMVAALSRTQWIRDVLFVNPDVWTSSLLSMRLGDRNMRARWRAIIPRSVDARIRVYTPLRLPLGGRLTAIRQLELAAQQWVLNGVKRPFVLLVNRPVSPNEPLVASLLEQAALKVFDWSDDFETFASTDSDRAATREACEYYLRASDVTVAVNDHLGDKARRSSRNVHVIRNGTDVDRFGAALATRELPKALRHLPRPIIGYSGYRVRDRLDLELIDHLVSSRPDWSFVFIGPHVGDEPLREIVRARRNVLALAPVDYTRLASYIANFDVCILPNRINAHTAGNDPIKLYDYLAAGKPIVSTRTSGADRLDGMVTIAEPGQPFLEAIEDELEKDSPATKAQRIQIAGNHSWGVRARQFAEVLHKALQHNGFFDPVDNGPAQPSADGKTANGNDMALHAVENTS